MRCGGSRSARGRRRCRLSNVSPSPDAGHEILWTAIAELVKKALKQAGDKKSKAAGLLGLTRAQLYSRIEKHGL